MAIWRGKRLFRMTNVAENCIAHQSTKAQRTEIMNTALIIQQQTGAAHCAECDGLVTRLRRTRSFEEIIHVRFQQRVVIFICCAGRHSCFHGQAGGRCAGFPMLQIRMAEDACRSDSVPGQACPAHDAVLAPSCFDEVIFCCASELEWKLRVQRILQAQAANDCCSIQKKPSALTWATVNWRKQGFFDGHRKKRQPGARRGRGADHR